MLFGKKVARLFIKFSIILLIIINGVIVFHTFEVAKNSVTITHKIAIYEDFSPTSSQMDEFIKYNTDNNILLYRSNDSNASSIQYSISAEENIILPTMSYDIYDFISQGDNSGVYGVDLSNSSITIEEYYTYIGNLFGVEVTASEELSEFYKPHPFNQLYFLFLIFSILALMILCIKQSSSKNVIEAEETTFNKEVSQKVLTTCVLSTIAMLVAFIMTILVYEYMSSLLLIAIVVLTLTTIFIQLFAYKIYHSLWVNKLSVYKSKKAIKTILSVLFVCLMSFILVFSTIVVSVNIPRYTVQLSRTLYLHQNSEELDDFLYTYGFINSDTFVADMEELNKALEENGAIVFEPYTADGTFDTTNTIVEVNENYIEYMGYEELLGYNFIVPMYLQEEFDMKCSGEKCESVYYYNEEVVVNNLNLATPLKYI